MRTLVVYASRHGATRGLAERVAEKLREKGLEVDLSEVAEAGEPSTYDAVVLGAAAYMGSWLKPAAEYARRHAEALASRPLWLFSSGPLGHDRTDAQGRDVLATCEPKEFAELKASLKPRGLQVFFGALDPAALAFSEKLIRRLPAGRELLPEGDFRDWTAVDAWAEGVAQELTGAPVPAAGASGQASIPKSLAAFPK